MKAKKFDRDFDAGKSVTDTLDLAGARRPRQEQRRVNVDFPTWMIERLDREAGRLGVTRQSIIKVWLAERLQLSASNQSLQSDAQQTGRRWSSSLGIKERMNLATLSKSTGYFLLGLLIDVGEPASKTRYQTGFMALSSAVGALQELA